MLLRKVFFASSVVVLAACGVVVNEEAQAFKQSSTASTYGGDPVLSNPFADTITRLQNTGFAIGYSETRKNPLWVGYRLYEVNERSQAERPTRFETDKRTQAQVRHSDYSGSGYDRGHMAANSLTVNMYGEEAQKESFLMSNITPQRHALNAGAWQRLEELEVGYFPRWFPDVWVVTGPIFSKKPETIGRAGVQVPTEFYKIFVGVDSRGWRHALAFKMKQNTAPNADLTTLVTTVDDIENLTGLDFFKGLDKRAEERLEAQNLPPAWDQLRPLANKPGRYSNQLMNKQGDQGGE